MNLKPLFVPHRSLPATGWTRVDVVGLWASTFRPLIDANTSLQVVLERTVEDWLAANPRLRRNSKRWRYRDPKAVAPFMLTVSDGAVTFVDQAIADAAEAGDEDAHAYHALVQLTCGDLDPPLSPRTVAELNRRANELYDRFTPTRDEVQWFRPYHSCHEWAPFTLALAMTWEPGADWRITSSLHHSTVVDLAGMRIFDLLLLGMDDSPDEPVLFVKGRGKSVKAIRETRKRNRKLFARAATEAPR